MTENKKKPFFFEDRKRTQFITGIVCLLIASIFWIFNALNNDYSTEFRYPVKFIYNKSKIVTTHNDVKQIDLAVTGYGWHLLSLTWGFDVTPIIVTSEDLNENKFITSAALLDKAKSSLREIRVNQVLNDALYFDYERLISKVIHLKLDKSKLNLPAGKKIDGKVIIDPSFIVCTGPEKAIQPLPDSIYFYIEDKFIEEDFSENVEINYKPSRQVTMPYETVKVNFKLSNSTGQAK